MIINNTQANIFKVNGGLADIFANRPTASGSFYVFYSIDTQEIFYDSGIWVLIGTGNLPTPTNIYNSDGTLTGNRILNGNNNNLTFSGIQTIVLLSNIGSGLYLTGVGSNTLITRFQGSKNGIDIEFANNIYRFGKIQGGNVTQLTIDDINQFIKTSYQGNDLGLKLDFASNTYQLGDCQNLISYNLDLNTKTFYFGDCNSTANGTQFFLSDSSSEIYTLYGGNFWGLKLDFANQDYIFGDINKAFINIQNFSSINAISLISSATVFITQQPNSPTTIRNQIISLSAFSGTNNVLLNVDAQSSAMGTSAQSLNQGFGFNFTLGLFQFGKFQGGNTTYLTIDDSAIYPIQFDGTNILSGSSGGSSGQHLKIKLNGVDYKIKLENP